ncbi:MAG: hypothetical protein WB697_14955 [Stellaceae bacterium]
MSRFGRSVVVKLAAALLCWVAGATVGSAQSGRTENQYNEQLLHMSPQEQASKLADHLGVWCIGTKPFYMGMTKTGASKGYAYWNVTCAGGQGYMIQITPAGQGAAVDCKTLKEQGEGRECYKTF